MLQLINIFTYFIIYSFLGWGLETVAKSITEKKFINSGFLNGPFCPIYGVGAIIMFLFLYQYKGNYILLFIIGFLVLSIWEYIVGIMLEKMFNTKYWDYSNKKFNIHGRICLENSVIWGVLGVAFTELIHPSMIDIVQKIPKNILIIFNISIILYMIIDFIVTAIKLNKINIKLVKFNEITESLKEKLEELKDIAETAKNRETLNSVIDELRRNKEELKEKIEKQTARLRKAFPTMKSESISKFLEEINTRIEKIKNNKE